MSGNKIFSLIPSIMADVGAIGKGGYNQHDKYKFRSIDDVYNALQPALIKHKVFFSPNVVQSHEERVQSAAGKDMVRVKLRVRYDIYADDGSKFEATVDGEAIDRSDKATNKALTACFKYMAIQVFCIAIEGMDDADKDSHTNARTAASQKLQAPVRDVAAIDMGQGMGPLDDDPPLGDYLVKVGRIKGKKLSDCGTDELAGALSWFEKNKPSSRDWAEFAEVADVYLATMRSKQ